MAETRGRKANKAPKTPQAQVNEKAFEEATQAARDLSLLKADFNNERDTLNQMIGRVQMGRAIGGLTNALNLQALKSIKESKSYRSLAGQTGVDRRGLPIHDIGTWDGFCRALGFSPDKLDDDLLNLDAFGAEALDGLTAIGAGYRELRQYRKLPEDSKQALIEVAKLGDKEGFVEIAEQIISKHAKEKESLRKEVEDVRLDLAAAEKRIATLREQRDAEEAAEARFAALAPEGKIAELQAKAMHSMQLMGVSILHLRRAMLEVQQADPLSLSFLAGLYKRACDELTAVRDELGLPQVSDVSAGALEYLQYQEAQMRSGAPE